MLAVPASRIYDPLVSLKIGREVISLPFSHPLSYNMSVFPQYNTNLPRIVKIVSNKEPDLTVIDIGANIGDTVAFIKNEANVPILCIEGNEDYLKILNKNVSQFRDVVAIKQLVGEEQTDSNYALRAERGTAFLERVEGKGNIDVKSLTTILKGHPQFAKSRILKTDTDGFDTTIIRGSKEFISNVYPVLFFEFDPNLIRKTEDPYGFLEYLHSLDYEYLMFYTNSGDFLTSLSFSENKLIARQLVEYFSGRNTLLFADICAFHRNDRSLFEECVDSEMKYFKKLRGF